MNVEVLFFGKLRELPNREQVVSSADGARLVVLIDRLAMEYGSDFCEEMNHVERLHIKINSQYHDLLDNMETHLKEGDVVARLPPLPGWIIGFLLPCLFFNNVKLKNRTDLTTTFPESYYKPRTSRQNNRWLERRRQIERRNNNRKCS